MSDVYKLGPALVLLGDPTVADGAGMQFLGHVRGEITVNPNINISFGRVDARGMIPIADATYNSGAAPVANIPFVDEELVKLKELLPGSTTVENGGKTALLLGSGVKRVPLADLKTLCIIPVDEVDDGVAADSAWWFPRAVCSQFGAIRFFLPENEDNLSNKTRDTQITSLWHPTDHADETVPSDARAGFQGAPSGAGITGWDLPDLTAFI